MKLNVDVTTYHIRNGERKNCERCAIAMAITPLLPVKHHASVSPEAVHVRHDRGMLGYEFKGISPLPQVAIEWIEQYDSGLPVKPITFEIEVDLSSTDQ